MAPERHTVEPPQQLLVRKEEVLRQFRARLEAGHDWFDTLLDAVAHWSTPFEVHDGREYRYLIGGEAFDWILLAERLVLSAVDLVPQEAWEELLFSGRLPRKISPDDFRARLGPEKHHAVMNYWYGVRVEEALALSVEQDMRKLRRGLAELEGLRLDDAIYQHIYGKTRRDLLKEFVSQQARRTPSRISIEDLREFTYWLFKYRVSHSDPARLASDTKKGLDWLRDQEGGEPHGWT